jgi:hypothetical protein
MADDCRIASLVVQNAAQARAVCQHASLGPLTKATGHLMLQLQRLGCTREMKQRATMLIHHGLLIKYLTA